MRDRERLTGRPGIPLEKAVQIHTWNAAEVCGFVDRGQITTRHMRKQHGHGLLHVRIPPHLPLDGYMAR